MRINIFRNPFMDAQVGYFLDSMIDARRKETEEYWRTVIVNEIRTRIKQISTEDGGYCFVVHLCDVEEVVELSRGQR